MSNEQIVAEVNELRQLVESLGRLVLQMVTATHLAQQWYTLEEACDLKGISSKTARNQPWLQPRSGVPDATVGRKKRWHRDTIRTWLEQTDDELLK
jgi:hypothetical protein